MFLIPRWLLRNLGLLPDSPPPQLSLLPSGLVCSRSRSQGHSLLDSSHLIHCSRSLPMSRSVCCILDRLSLRSQCSAQSASRSLPLLRSSHSLPGSPLSRCSSRHRSLSRSLLDTSHWSPHSLPLQLSTIDTHTALLPLLPLLTLSSLALSLRSLQLSLALSVELLPSSIRSILPYALSSLTKSLRSILRSAVTRSLLTDSISGFPSTLPRSSHSPPSLLSPNRHDTNSNPSMSLIGHPNTGSHTRSLLRFLSGSSHSRSHTLHSHRYASLIPSRILATSPHQIPSLR